MVSCRYFGRGVLGGGWRRGGEWDSGGVHAYPGLIQAVQAHPQVKLLDANDEIIIGFIYASCEIDLWVVGSPVTRSAFSIDLEPNPSIPEP